MKVENLVYYRCSDLKTYRRILISLPVRLIFSNLGFKNWVLCRIKELEKMFHFVYGTAEY